MAVPARAMAANNRLHNTWDLKIVGARSTNGEIQTASTTNSKKSPTPIFDVPLIGCNNSKMRAQIQANSGGGVVRSRYPL
jgi:hypothetical protein